MQRYQEFTDVILATQKKRRYSTLYYPSFERKTSDIFIVGKITHRLDLLAAEYYGDPRYWVVIAKANKLYNGTMRIPPGMRIRIPYPMDPSETVNEFVNSQA